MPKSLKFGNAILCEFVARGDRNKHTLVNVFSGDVVLQNFPADLQFGIYVEYYPLFEDALELWLEVKIDEESIMKAQVSLPSGSCKKPTTIIVPAMKFIVTNDAKFSVEVSCQGYRTATILSKRILRGELPPA